MRHRTKMTQSSRLTGPRIIAPGGGGKCTRIYVSRKNRAKREIDKVNTEQTQSIDGA